MLADDDLSSIRALCERTLVASWRQGRLTKDGTPFAYTCPSPGHYPWQWYWDSCFTAIVWRRFDPARSRRELQSLLTAQREDGFIGHTIFWNTPLTGSRRLTYNVTLARRVDDREHPAAGARLGVADRRRGPRRARGSSPPRMAAKPTVTSTATV